MNIDKLNQMTIESLRFQLAAANQNTYALSKRANELADLVDDKDHGVKLWCNRATELADQVDEMTHKNKALNAEVRKLTDRLDTVSDQLDWETGKRIFHEKRAERLTWFIEHLSEQLWDMGTEIDRKMAEEV